jgi:acetyl esterase/lipase
VRGFTSAVVFFAALSAQAQSRIQDVIYLKQGGCAYTMDVFKPKTTNHKAVVWLVSGGWISSHEGISEPLAKVFTDKGFTVFEVVHGSQPKYTIPEIVPMVRHAIRFVRYNASTYDILPNAIGVSGMSAGGHLSLEIAGLGDDGDPNAKDPVDRVSSRADAVVAFMPPTDFENWGADGAMPFKNPAMAVFYPAFGVTGQTPKEAVERIAHDTSPIQLIKPGYPPTLIIHGDKDALVPLQQAKRMDAALETGKIVHKLVVIPGGGHDATTLIGGIAATLHWFSTHLPASG